MAYRDLRTQGSRSRDLGDKPIYYTTFHVPLKISDSFKSATFKISTSDPYEILEIFF